MNNAEIAVDARATLGEGPSWDARNQILYWVDIPKGSVHSYDYATSTDTSITVGNSPSCVVPRRSGGLAVTLEHGFYTLDLKTRETKLIAEVEEVNGTRFNDGKCDPRGRFWAGTMDTAEKNPSGSLYRLEPGGKLQRIFGNVTISNGLGWSPDNRTMYYIDSATRKVFAFDYDDMTGDVRSKRTIVDLDAANEPGFPDGLAVDEEGKIWVAQWGGFKVSRWDPESGVLLDSIAVPAPHTSSCCFGGSNLEDLFITTARNGLDQETLAKYPLSGGLFRARVGAKGLPTNLFAD